VRRRPYAPTVATHPYVVVNRLWTAKWSGDPKLVRDAIFEARAAGMRLGEIARELRTTVGWVRAAITFPT
jgi:hypothetical protein